MKLIASLKDDQYPFRGIDHIRETARCVLLDDNDNVCLEYIKDDDGFGPRDYYELPGGGIQKGETNAQALEREMEEEAGFHIEIICELGDVKDYYNLIKRQNLNHYFLARRKEACPQRLEEDEKVRISKIMWVPIQEAIALYEGMQNVLVGKLVKQRELPILKLANTALQNAHK